RGVRWRCFGAPRWCCPRGEAPTYLPIAVLPGALLIGHDVRVAIALIGYWRSTREPDWPDPQDFVDDSWDPEERDLVARYLESGASPPWMQCGPSWCRICSSDPLERIDQDRMNQAERVRSSGDFNGTGEWTDGVYLWPEGLSYYVREHAVHLPVVIIEHIR